MRHIHEMEQNSGHGGGGALHFRRLAGAIASSLDFIPWTLESTPWRGIACSDSNGTAATHNTGDGWRGK